MPLCLRQAALQYTTVSQVRAHFLRHVNGRPQTGQTRVGRSDFFTPRIVKPSPGAGPAR